MDNKGNQNKNGKNPRGQNYAVLIMTMLFTLLCVAMMHNLWQGSRTHKMPYSEFNQMLKDHEVESVVIGNGKIQITPKEDSKKYGGSQGKYGNLVGMEYYTIPINDPDLEKKLDEAGVTTYEQAEVDATGSIIMLLLEWVLPIAAMFDEAHGRRRRHNGCRQEQCQSICTERDRCYVQGCGRRG